MNSKFETIIMYIHTYIIYKLQLIFYIINPIIELLYKLLKYINPILLCAYIYKNYIGLYFNWVHYKNNC